MTLLGVGVAILVTSWLVRSVLAPRPDACVEAIRKRGYPVTLAELEAWYPSLPPAENAALIYTNAFALLSRPPVTTTNYMGRNWVPLIGQGLSAERRTELKRVLAENHAALGLLYSVPATARSRYPVRLKDGFTMRLPYSEKIKQAVCLLTAEGLMHASENDAEAATRAFLAAGRVADSTAQEPVIVSQLTRLTHWGILLSRLEKALSLTRFTAPQLASLQQMTEAAERPGSSIRAWAGERVLGLSAFTDRKTTELAFWGFQAPRSQSERFDAQAGSMLFRVTGLLAKDEAFYCDTMRRHLEALELPYPARFAAVQQLAATATIPNRFYVLSRMLLPALGKVHTRETEHVALVRAITAALAVERFRLAHINALPAGLEQLTPAWCKTLPTDPFDGNPLRYKTHGASYVVYSVGSDGRDEGGVNWDSNYTKLPLDVGVVVKH